MVDDFFNPQNPEQDCHSCACQDKIHKIIEFVIDPGSNELSASRACFIWLNVIGSVLASAMVFAGIVWNVQGVFTPAAAIVTGLVASDAGVYFASTRKNMECNK